MMVRVPYPLPWTGNSNEYMSMPKTDKEFLNRVGQNSYGETGLQKEGTKTVLDQYSLDHYMAQQWNLDVDNMPGTMPEQLSAV